jgi:hypothetical protein
MAPPTSIHALSRRLDNTYQMEHHHFVNISTPKDKKEPAIQEDKCFLWEGYNGNASRRVSELSYCSRAHWRSLLLDENRSSGSHQSRLVKCAILKNQQKKQQQPVQAGALVLPPPPFLLQFQFLKDSDAEEKCWEDEDLNALNRLHDAIDQGRRDRLFDSDEYYVSVVQHDDQQICQRATEPKRISDVSLDDFPYSSSLDESFGMYLLL